MDHTWIAPNEIDDLLNPNYYRGIYLDATRKVNLDGRQRTLASISQKIADGPFGSQLKTEEYLSSGIPLFRVSDVQNLSINLTEIVYISSEKQKQLSRSKVVPGDILITKAGRIGSSSVVPLTIQEANITSHLALIRLKSGIDPYFVAAFLESKYGRLLSERSSHKSTRPELTKTEVEKIPVYLPDPKIQAYIGDKVRLAEKCREEANKCASLANQMLFDILSWPIEFMNEQSHFVDTKIVNDRLDPKYYQNKYLQTLKLIHNYVAGYVLLDQFVESISNGSEYREYTSDGIPYLTVGDISDGRLLWKKAPRIPSSAPISDRGKLKVHDVLVVRTGSIGQAAFVHHACKDAIISSHFIKLRLSSPRRAPWIAFFLNSTVGKILLERIAYGAIQPQIGQDELLRIPIPLIDLRYENEIARYWTSQILLKEISEDLITEAKLDVENLIEGKLNISSLQTDNQQTMQWETIDSNIQEKLAEYA